MAKVWGKDDKEPLKLPFPLEGIYKHIHEAYQAHLALCFPSTMF